MVNFEIINRARSVHFVLGLTLPRAGGSQVVVSRARLFVGAAEKQSGHCCTHSVTTAGMLAEPIRSLRAFYETITHILLSIPREVKD